MKAFSVWMTRLDGASRLRVDGLENANWLIGRLSESFVFKTSTPIDESRDSPNCAFSVAHNSHMSGPRIERLLAGIAEVHLRLETAQHA